MDEDAHRDRQDEYLAFATRELEPGNPLSVLAHAERAARDDGFVAHLGAVTVAALQPILDDIDAFEDTTDFDLLYLLNLWYGYRDLLPAEVRQAIEQRFLAFKYWYTEPTPDGVVDDKWYWSENHRAIFHVCEHLAGQAFPDEVFTNDGRTGAEHRDEARDRLAEWVEEKVRFGFTEWHSDVYYQKDATPLLSLVEWAEDVELAQQAAMVLDLVLFDLALHLHDGYFGATHGRSYIKDKSQATDEDTFGLAKLLFDDTGEPYQPGVDAGAVLFARARRYRLPEVIRRVARSDDTTVDRERMGVPLDPGAPVVDDPEAPYGYDFDDPANVPFWCERGAQTTWQMVALTLRTLDEHGLWDSRFFSPFRALADGVGDDMGAARSLARSLAPMLCFGLLTEANTYTYRSPHVMLSTVQDHRPGVYAEQQHTWQATLDARAAVFTTHPKSEPQEGTRWPDTDGYWNGTGSAPRSVQHGRAALHLYSPAFPSQGEGPLSAFTWLPYTHAWFPTERFDLVTSEAGWTFGRRGDGYVGLWSWRPVRWREHDPARVHTNGLTRPFDLVADGGPDNVWIVEVGDAATAGSFEEFRAGLAAAPIEVEPRPSRPDGLPGGFDVRYTSPAEGVLAWGTDGPFSVDGEEVAVDGYPRFDNPWAQVPFDSRRVEIADGDHRLVLDFESGRREVSGP